MGDPRRQVNKYSGPRHPWERARIDEEKILSRDYGLKNKKEIWKEASFIKKIKKQVVMLNSVVGEKADVQKAELLKKLIELSLLNPTQTLDDALNLTTHNVMERRLQTQVVRQGLARTMMQARQFIIHGHIKVNGNKVTAPSYMVNREEQFKLEFVAISKLSDPEHPERKLPDKKNAETSPVVDETKTEEETVAEEVEKELASKIEEEI